MPTERALHAYQNERLNCAQSVLHAFRACHAIPDEAIVQAKALGGGRAEGGVCGSLFAALLLVRDPVAQQRLRDAFIAKAGSDKCREIKQVHRFPCAECVRLAASLVAEQSGEGKKA